MNIKKSNCLAGNSLEATVAGLGLEVIEDTVAESLTGGAFELRGPNGINEYDSSGVVIGARDGDFSDYRLFNTNRNGIATRFYVTYRDNGALPVGGFGGRWPSAIGRYYDSGESLENIGNNVTIAEVIQLNPMNDRVPGRPGGSGDIFIPSNPG